MIAQPSRLSILGLLSLAGLSALGPLGCAGNGRSQGSTTVVKASDFSGGPNSSPIAAATPVSEPHASVLHTAPARTSEPRPELTGPVSASDNIFDVYAQIGRPTLSASDAGPVEDPVLVQSKVGDINGRAIYALDFLAPMEAQFKVEAKKRKPADWNAFIEKEIRRELDTKIEDELLMAEARESFTPEQKKGFLAFLEDMRDDLYSKNRGSRSAANKKLFETEGVDEEQWMRDREQKELIQFQIMQMINKKTVVSWREIQQSYDRAYDKWNPPPVAYFHVIRVPTAKKERVAAVQEALDRGEDFATLAAGPDNIYNRAQAGLEKRPLDADGDLTKAELFGIEKLNAAAQGLQPGQWAGPIPWGEATAWVYLAGIEKINVSLYDAQLRIEGGIRDFKREHGRKKYIDRIKARSSITNVDEMTQRLMAIAAERFYPAALGVKPVAAPSNKADTTRPASRPAESERQPSSASRGQ